MNIFIINAINILLIIICIFGLIVIGVQRQIIIGKTKIIDELIEN